MSIVKEKVHPDYPPEEGRYMRGNDFSPVAVAIILNCDEDKIPSEIENLIRAGVEGGAALSGSVQTPNIGFEKIVCNIVSNPNIRYLILGGPESAGHFTGEALKALVYNGVDKGKRIIGTNASHAILYNLPIELIERFRKQISLIDLQFEGDPAIIKKAIWSCFQENPVTFHNYSLYDPGAYPEPPLSGKITHRITQPWSEPDNDKEREAVKKAKELIEFLRSKTQKK